MTDSNVYKSLLEATQAIPWKIDWASKNFEYIGPQIEAILGWPVNSWGTANDWVERIHPEDRKLVVDFCMSQSIAGKDHEATYRATNADGEYVWIRDVVHVLRDQAGNTIALVGFMFKSTNKASIELSINAESERFKFTTSEDKIIRLLTSGKTQKQVANLLNVKPDTVRKHLKSIYRKTNTNNQSQLITLMVGMPNAKVDLLNN